MFRCQCSGISAPLLKGSDPQTVLSADALCSARHAPCSAIPSSPCCNQYLAVICHPSSVLLSSRLLSSVIRPLSSVLCPLSSVLCPLSSVLCPLSSVLCPLSSVLCLLSSVFCPLSSVPSCLLSSVFCFLSSVFCPLSSVLCLLSFDNHI